MLKIHSGLPRLGLKRQPPPPPQENKPLDHVQLSEKPKGSAWRRVAAPLMLATFLSGPLAVGMLHCYPQANLPRRELEAKLTTLRADLRQHQLRVSQGQETGAQALCAVMQDEARLSRSSEEFVQLNQALFVHNDWIVNLPTGAPSIPHSQTDQPPVESFVGLPTTGWKIAYKDRMESEDQTHHLAAYVSLGYYRGAATAGAGAYYHELENKLQNGGDINLGVLAGQFGAQLRHTPAEQLPNKVARLCAQLTDPKTQPTPAHWSLPEQP